jgi:DtxR family transcriptional regulator, Mn-dependent transcriptional regulator
MQSTSEENYLKAIYKLISLGSDIVPNGALAEEMSVQAASVSDMIRRLSEKGLVHYQKNKGVHLTSDGKKAALMILRKHRLWEVFLTEKLKFGWDEVHEIAEQLEHIQSDELTDRLCNFLGNPVIDPHGDPIPDKDGKMPELNYLPLMSAEPGRKYAICRLLDSSTDFLQYLDKLGLSLGTLLKVIGQESFDQSVQIEFSDGRKMYISQQVAEMIVVEEKSGQQSNAT